PSSARRHRRERYLTSRSYEWVVEGDIEACFDRIDRSSLMARVRRRVGDKRVVALVKAFLNAGILSQDGSLRDSQTGTPQGGILSPLLANIALSVLDEFVAAGDGGPGSTQAERARRRRRDSPTIASCATRTTFWCWSRGTRTTPWTCASRSPRFSPRWVCAC